MTYSTRLAHPGELGFDSLEPITDAMVQGLVDAHLTFAIRTVETLTRDEIARLTAAGISVAWYSEARTAGWDAESGAEDGARAAKEALSLGIPPDTSAGCDMEGAVPDEATAIAYANAWYEAAVTTGLSTYAPLHYRGAGSGFVHSTLLFQKLHFRRYWRSMSQVPDVAVRGDCLLQLYPPDVRLAGAVIDYDVVQQDYLGGLPIFAVAV